MLAVGGWSDPYRNAVLDLLENLSSPGFGLIGPWAHGYPLATRPGPMIGFLSECARFFGRYVRDEDNGYDREPPLRAYLQSFDCPAAYHAGRSGRWIAVGAWLAHEPERTRLTLALGERALSAPAPDTSASGTQAPAGFELRVGSAQANGLAAGNWCPYGVRASHSTQRSDDALSLCFDSRPLERSVEVLGFPLLRLHVCSDRPRAFVAARLCDVSPTGESLLVTRGILNLTHRAGHDAAAALEPGAVDLGQPETVSEVAAGL